MIDRNAAAVDTELCRMQFAREPQAIGSTRRSSKVVPSVCGPLKKLHRPPGRGIREIACAWPNRVSRTAGRRTAGLIDGRRAKLSSTLDAGPAPTAVRALALQRYIARLPAALGALIALIGLILAAGGAYLGADEHGA